MQPESHVGGCVYYRIQYRTRQNEHNGNIQRHSLLDQAADQGDHTAFAYRENKAEKTGEQDAKDRIFGNPFAELFLRYIQMQE
ncbi:hypothetical protein D3C75_1010340 [compost metagenome]